MTAMIRQPLDDRARSFVLSELTRWGPFCVRLSASELVRAGRVSTYARAQQVSYDFAHSAGLDSERIAIRDATAAAMVGSVPAEAWAGVWEHPYARAADAWVLNQPHVRFGDHVLFAVCGKDGRASSLVQALCRIPQNPGALIVGPASSVDIATSGREANYDVIIKGATSCAVPAYDGEGWLLFER